MSVNKTNKKARQRELATLVIPPPPGPEAPCHEIDTYFSKYSWAEIEKSGHLKPLTEEESAWVAEISVEARKRIEARQNRAL
jgi:hypothetical protein